MASINLFLRLPDFPSQSDIEAIESDWRKVGDDLRNSFASHPKTVDATTATRETQENT